MKLRNKKTGEIVEYDEIGFRKGLSNGWKDFVPNAESITELNENWEDYRPTEPLIKDEKSRKVFQEWVKLYDAERFRVTHLFNSKGHITVLLSTDLTTEPSIELPGHIGKDSEIYTRVELCGEEEPRPVIVNDIKYSSYEDCLKSRGKK